jgi:hypothetical protein
VGVDNKLGLQAHLGRVETRRAYDGCTLVATSVNLPNPFTIQPFTSNFEFGMVSKLPLSGQQLTNIWQPSQSLIEIIVARDR